jgi:hypothetical protein
MAWSRSIRLIALLGSLAASLVVFTMLASPFPVSGSALARIPPSDIRVLIVRGGDDFDTDSAVFNTLTDAGYDFPIAEVANMPKITEFTSSSSKINQDVATFLQQFDVVVLLHYDPGTIPSDGQTALAQFVERGGGLITAEWTTWIGNLDPLLPATSCGNSQNEATQTTLTVRNRHPIVHQGVSDTFTIALGNPDAVETCLSPKDGAIVLYDSSHGGGEINRPALLGWNKDEGRVASFSTLLSDEELASADFQRLLQNTVAWVGGVDDLTPPTVTIETANADGLANSRDVQIAISAADTGGSLLSRVAIVEYVYSGNPQKPWTRVNDPVWSVSRAASRTLNWTLSADPGLHYLQVFVADGAGNTSKPDLVFTNYQPATVDIGLDETRIYRIQPSAGTNVTVQMAALAGNPDLYLFGDNVSFHPESDASSESTSFTADGGIYQIEIEVHQVASRYGLSVTPGSGLDTPAAGLNAEESEPIGGDLDRRPRGSIISFSSYEPGIGDAGLPAPPLEEQTIYLPQLAQ